MSNRTDQSYGSYTSYRPSYAAFENSTPLAGAAIS
jgi:hypothetical protein